MEDESEVPLGIEGIMGDCYQGGVQASDKDYFSYSVGFLDSSRCSVDDTNTNETSLTVVESPELEGSCDPKGDIPEQCIEIHGLGNLKFCLGFGQVICAVANCARWRTS